MPSAKTVRPTTDPSRPESSKRLRLSHGSSTKKAKAATIFSDAGLPAALAATATTCKVPKFLRSLYAILQTEDPHLIAWVQNENLRPNCVTAFHILEMKRFEREILPKYFKHQKFASFQRQLNNFGFRKWTKTQSSGVCTFSHNCFPPDLSRANSSSMSIRDQWRQKSTHVASPSTSASGGQLMNRRNVGNKISKSKIEHQQMNQLSVPSITIQAPRRDVAAASPFAEMYRSPNSNTCMESSAFHHGRSHQPPLKKLARPNIVVKQDTSDSLNGLEAFCEDSFRQFTLPPLQPHRLLVSTGIPRNLASPVSSAPSFSTPGSNSGIAQASSEFRLSLAQMLNNSSAPSTLADSSFSNRGLKPFDLKHSEAQAHNGSNGTADADALQGAFLEPWMWDAQTLSSNFEVGSFPLELDCKNDFDGKTEFDWQEGSSANTYEGMLAESTGVSNEEPCYQQDRNESATTEEVGLDILLFVE